MIRLFALVATFIFTGCCAWVPVASVQSPQPRTDWSAVDAVLGRSGARQLGNVYKFGFPRTDLDVRIGDVRLKPGLALGSWAAFMDVGGGTQWRWAISC